MRAVNSEQGAVVEFSDCARSSAVRSQPRIKSSRYDLGAEKRKVHSRDHRQIVQFEQLPVRPNKAGPSSLTATSSSAMASPGK